MTGTAQILILDPDEQTAGDCIQAFEERGWHTDWRREFSEAWELLQRNYYDVAVIELLLPDTDGTEAWAAIHKLSPSTIGIILTSSISLHASVYVLEPGILAYLQKPLHLTNITDLICHALHQQQAIPEVPNIERQLAGLNSLLSSFANTADPNHIIDQTLSYLERIFQFDWAAIYLTAEEGNGWKQFIQPRLFLGKVELTVPQREFILQRCVEVINSLQPQHLVQPEISGSGKEAVSLRQLGLRELALVPIIGVEESSGVLAVISGMHWKTSLKPLDIQLLTSISQGMALAFKRARLAKELASEAIHDPATGLFTMAYLDRLIEIETARWKRYATPFSLVTIDLAHLLASLTDSQGPSGADRLEDILKFARSLLRRSDVIARLSNWEVAILLPDTSLEGAQQLVARVTKTFREHLATHCATPVPTILTRIIAPSHDANNLNDMLRLAPA